MAGNPLHNTEASPLTYSPFIFSPGGGRSGRRKGPTIFKGAGLLVCNAYLRMNAAKTTLVGAGLLSVNEIQRQKWSGSATFAGAGRLAVNETFVPSPFTAGGGSTYQLLFAA